MLNVVIEIHTNNVQNNGNVILIFLDIQGTGEMNITNIKKNLKRTFS